jgi:hypothetical protein
LLFIVHSCKLKIQDSPVPQCWKATACGCEQGKGGVNSRSRQILCTPAPTSKKHHLIDVHSLRERKNPFSESAGGKSLMHAEILLEKEEKLSANIRLFCI